MKKVEDGLQFRIHIKPEKEKKSGDFWWLPEWKMEL
jgi:hypothetical protein